MFSWLASRWARWRAAADVRSARAFHRAMGHSCSFCTYQKPKDNARS